MTEFEYKGNLIVINKTRGLKRWTFTIIRLLPSIKVWTVNEGPYTSLQRAKTAAKRKIS